VKVEQLELKGLLLLTPRVYRDERGFFFEVLRKDELKAIGIEHELVQVNQSFSVKNVIRGLHYQSAPKAQGKLVRVIAGKIIDVAVDIRPQSETFLRWTSVILDADNPMLFWLPRGFAHGFGVLSDTAIVEYQCDEYFAPEYDAGILYNDAELNIDWGIVSPLLSDKDRNNPSVKQINFKPTGETI